MLNSRLVFLISLGTASLASCSRTDVASTKDIAAGDARGAVTFMYWRDANWLVRGVCERDKPVLRHNCSSDSQKAVWTTVENNLRGDNPTKLSAMAKDRDELQKQLAALDAAQQSDPNNPDLSEDRAAVARDLEKVLKNFDVLNKEKVKVDKFISRIIDQQIVYRMLSTDHRYLSDRPYIAQIEKLLGRGDELPPEPAHPVPNPEPAHPIPAPEPAHPIPTPEPAHPVPFPSPNSTFFQDPVTNRIFMMIENRSTRDQAIASCASIKPGKWRAVGVFGGISRQYGECIDDSTVGSRLFQSTPALQWLPRSHVDNLTPTIVVWSRCLWGDGTNAAEGIHPVTGEFLYFKPSAETRLPVICENYLN